MKQLEVSSIGRRYSRRADETQARIAELVLDAFLPWRRPKEGLSAHEFWALRDISFSLDRGKAIGIIGHNGAGKTTLLRMLTGQILPDEGEIRVRGQIGAMIDLMAGFQPDMPGRENIYLRSAMMGRDRRQTDKLIDEIIAFTELDDAIFAPFHTYSAGMKMRLAFASTVFMSPDIMIVDEVLSVGDFRFRQKCLERIRAMRERCAFVLVSHSMTDISRFCNETIVLERGREVFRGIPADAIAFYETSRSPVPAPKLPVQPVAKLQSHSVLGDFIHNERAISNVSHEWVDANGRTICNVPVGGELRLRVRFELTHAATNPIIGVPIFNSDGRRVTSLSSEQSRFAIEAETGHVTEVEVRVPRCALAPGVYNSVVAVVDGPEFLYRNVHADLTVTHGGHPNYIGDVVTEQEWRSNSRSTNHE